MKNDEKVRPAQWFAIVRDWVQVNGRYSEPTERGLLLRAFLKLLLLAAAVLWLNAMIG